MSALRAKTPVLLLDRWAVLAARAKRVSEFVPRSKDQVASSLKFMDKLLAKGVSKGKIQDIEAKEARDRITVLDYDTQGVEGFRDADMVIEVIVSVLVRTCPIPDNFSRLPRRTYNSSNRYSNLFPRR